MQLILSNLNSVESNSVEELSSVSTSSPSLDLVEGELESDDLESVPSDEVEPEEEDLDDRGIFQAVGIIRGEISLGEDGKNSVSINGLKYPLLYSPFKRKVFDALLKEIENTGELVQRLIVYPKITHFPKKEVPHAISFQVVGFDKGRQSEGISEELEDSEFKLSGLWQFIPVCKTPCVSIFKNFTKERLEHIKDSEPLIRARYMKSNHVPLLWRDAPVKPFRFNPKLCKDQGRPYFVSVKAKFLPQRGVFGFCDLLSPPQEKAPKFLKLSKKDKAAALAGSKGVFKNKPEASDGDKKVIKKDKPAPPKIKPKA